MVKQHIPLPVLWALYAGRTRVATARLPYCSLFRAKATPIRWTPLAAVFMPEPPGAPVDKYSVLADVVVAYNRPRRRVARPLHEPAARVTGA